ncbi:Transcriptional regulator, partial [Snodgrassella alvi SCGC AB-598-O02]
YAQENVIKLRNPAFGARYDLHAMLIEAALAGIGVALVPRFYVENELAQGRLVSPWPEGKTISKTFCIILQEPIELSREPVQAFVQWILEEARSS